MKDLLDRVFDLRQHCQTCGDQVSGLVGLSSVESDPRTGCFAMVFNKATLALELLGYYYQIWEKHVRLHPEEIEAKKKENWQRCNELLKHLYVMSMSVIEYSAKASVSLYADHSLAGTLQRCRGRFLYLSDIVRNSVESSMVDGRDWEGLIAIRNCVVHNNAIPEQTQTYRIGDMEVRATAGIMLQGELDFFVRLTEVAVSRYFDWITALIKRCSG